MLFHLRPVIACIEKEFLPLRQKMDWGYSIPYMITGLRVSLKKGGAVQHYAVTFDAPGQMTWTKVLTEFRSGPCLLFVKNPV